MPPPSVAPAPPPRGATPTKPPRSSRATPSDSLARTLLVRLPLLLLLARTLSRAVHLYDATLPASSLLLDVAVDLLLLLTGGEFHSLPLAPTETTPTLSVLAFKRWGERTFVRHPRWEGAPPLRLAVQGVDVVVARPLSSASEPPPLAIYAHKGGMVVGHAADRDLLPRLVRAGFVVVSVEYPLSPEHPFPAALTAVERVARHLVLTHPNETLHGPIRADPTRVAIVGFSAGGNLAAAAAQTAAREGWRGVKAHLVAGGMLRRSQGEEGGSLHQFAHRPTLSALDLDWFWRAYLGSQQEQQRCGARCEPLLGAGRGLPSPPPLVLLVPTHDVLRDENLEYARRVAESGGRAHVVHAAGTHWGAVIFDDEAVMRAVGRLWEVVVNE